MTTVNPAPISAPSPAAPPDTNANLKTAPVNTIKSMAASPATTGMQAIKLALNIVITSAIYHPVRLMPNVIMKAVLKNIVSNIAREIMKKLTENVPARLITIYRPVLPMRLVRPAVENILLMVAKVQLIKIQTELANLKELVHEVQFFIPMVLVIY